MALPIFLDTGEMVCGQSRGKDRRAGGVRLAISLVRYAFCALLPAEEGRAVGDIEFYEDACR